MTNPDTDVKTITDHEYVESPYPELFEDECDYVIGATEDGFTLCEKPKSAHAVSGSATKEK